MNSNDALSPNDHVSDKAYRKKATQFLTHLHDAISNKQFNEMLSWSEDGSYFMIVQPETFAETVLPLYYRHNKLTSFIRQLNMYGFKKRVSTLGYMAYAHQYFLRDSKDELHLIERNKNFRNYVKSKKENTQDSETVVQKLVLENNALKDDHRRMEMKLADMQRRMEYLYAKNVSTETELQELKNHTSRVACEQLPQKELQQSGEYYCPEIKRVKKDEITAMTLLTLPNAGEACNPIGAFPNFQELQYSFPIQLINRLYNPNDLGLSKHQIAERWRGAKFFG
jgi:hypothetical protein